MSRPLHSLESLHGLLADGRVRSAAEVLAGLAASPATLSRLVAADARGPARIERIGAARAMRYALRRHVQGAGSRWPLWRMREDGGVQALGELIALAGGRWRVDADHQAPAWLLGGHRDGLFDDLPWWLLDVRPQGFLGRALAHREARALGVPEDPRLWSAEDQVRRLAHDGQDLPGCLGVGDPPTAAGRREVEAPSRWPDHARSALDGEVAGSSAGGEQPKFALGRPERLVKFAMPGDGNAARWRDLLLLEHLALEALARAGLPAARSTLHDVDGWRFLEVERFDRTPAGGRRAVVSLETFRAEFLGGAPGDWPGAAARLVEVRRTSHDEALRLVRSWCFGRLIGNTDMHDGNASLFLADDASVALTPVYDMLPMAWRPLALGPRPYAPVVRPTGDGPPEAMDWARPVASDFWQRVADDARLPGDLRAIAGAHARGVMA
jgi:hypothetical protein